MVESIPQFPYLQEKSIYLGVVMSRKDSAYQRKYALIEVPTRRSPLCHTSKFAARGTPYHLAGRHYRFNLPKIFAYFGYEKFIAHIIKVTKDAEFDIDYDEPSPIRIRSKKELKAAVRASLCVLCTTGRLIQDCLNTSLRRMGLQKRPPDPGRADP
ncbi:MAG: hypothetical protein MZU84_02975 [Sphingobacterium sp.]|nr:hypothetical protein [Sphingobacterium sp.]